MGLTVSCPEPLVPCRRVREGFAAKGRAHWLLVYTLLEMPLREQQLRAIETLDWLLSHDEDDRGSGRTYVMAVALIRQAARFPRTRVDFVDHIGGRRMQLHIGQLVGGLVASDPYLHRFSEMRQGSFALNLPRPVDNWLPERTPLQQALNRASTEEIVQAVSQVFGERDPPVIEGSYIQGILNHESQVESLLQSAQFVPPRSRYERLRENNLLDDEPKGQDPGTSCA